MTSFPPPQPPPSVAESRLQKIFGFRTRLYLTWAAMLVLFASFFL
ncbi:MAG: amino acid ABC transporter permease, partial [Pseudomonas sp.]